MTDFYLIKMWDETPCYMGAVEKTAEGYVYEAGHRHKVVGCTPEDCLPPWAYPGYLVSSRIVETIKEAKDLVAGYRIGYLWTLEKEHGISTLYDRGHPG